MTHLVMNTYTHKHTQIYTHMQTLITCAHNMHAHTTYTTYAHAHTYYTHHHHSPHTFTLCTHTCAHTYTHTHTYHTLTCTQTHTHTYPTLTCTQTHAHTQHAHMQTDTVTCKYTHKRPLSLLALSKSSSFLLSVQLVVQLMCMHCKLFDNYSTVKSKNEYNTRHVYYMYHTVRPIKL